MKFYRPGDPVLYSSLALGSKAWNLPFTIGLGRSPRVRMITAGGTAGLLSEINVWDSRTPTGEIGPWTT